MMTKSEIVAHIKENNRTIRKDADVRVIRGGLDAKDVSVDRTGSNRDILVVANTASIDCDNEVVVPEGADMTYLGRNAKVFVDHRYDINSMVGGIRNGYPKLVDGAWHVKFGVRRSDLGDQILRDAEDFGLGVSIGFDALEAGPPTEDELKAYGKGREFRSIVRKWHWIELSVTAMPCNVDCQSVREAPEPPTKKLFTLTPSAIFWPATA